MAITQTIEVTTQEGQKIRKGAILADVEPGQKYLVTNIRRTEQFVALDCTKLTVIKRFLLWMSWHWNRLKDRVVVAWYWLKERFT